MSETCTARQTTGTGPDDPKDTGIHTCVDLPDHSAGAHLCNCGFMWRGAKPPGECQETAGDNQGDAMSEIAYVVGSLGDDGFHINRIYLDREEAERFIEAHNAVDFDYSIEEWPIGVPAVEYDGPRWEAEWTPRFWLEDRHSPPLYEPRWIEEKLRVHSDWHTGSPLPKAAVTYNNGHMVQVRGSSKEHVEKVIQDAIAQVKAERAGL